MTEIGRVSIRVPSTITPGDVIRIRSLVIHPMEIVQRDKQGKIIHKSYNFIYTVTVRYNGKEVIRAETTQAISQNPMFTFPVKVDRPGKITITYADTTGITYEGSAEVKFS